LKKSRALLENTPNVPFSVKDGNDLDGRRRGPVNHGVGIALVALVLSQVMASLLYGIKPHDPLTLMAVSA